VPAKKQLHQRNRPSISDYDDSGDYTNSKFSEEAIESRDLENLDEFHAGSKIMAHGINWHSIRKPRAQGP
jgi:hypothetical protein